MSQRYRLPLFSRTQVHRFTTGAFSVVLAYLLIGFLLRPGLASAQNPHIETLAPADDIVIASGTNLASGGTGLFNTGAGTINVNVPLGATVKQVLLYWEGRDSADQDDELIVNGTPVTGTLVGRAALSTSLPSFAYRADITSLGVIVPGANAVDISGFDPIIERRDGASIVVIYEDASGLGDIFIRDGADFAWLQSMGPQVERETVPQVFTFAADPVERKAKLVLSVGDTTPTRPDRLLIMVDGVVFLDQINFFVGLSGPQWSNREVEVPIPAGATTVTVQIFSGPGANAESLTWTVGSLVVPPPVASLGDFVWNDRNADGIQDPGEPGVDGVTVTLASLGDDPTCAMTDPPSDVATATTAGGGLYNFGGLATGCYQVTFSDLPPGFVFSPQDQGADDTVDSDADPASGVTAPIPLAVGEDNPTIDAGINAPTLGSIGDFVWNDLNADGIQDPGEPGREGVRVRLSSLGDDPTCATTVPATTLAETTTDADGLYSFEDLEAGCYKITFLGIFLAGLEFSPQNQGTDDTVDSDADPVSGATAAIPLAAGEDNPTIDAGIVVPVSVGSIGDFVWNDLNGDGIQDAGEPGLDGVTLTLRDPGANGTCESDDAVLQTRTTAGGGLYLFNGTLSAGDYCVEVDDANFAAGGALEGFSVSPTNEGGDPALDSNDDPSLVTLTAADNEDLTIDFGYFTPASLGDFVWNDLNGDGIQDAGEPGIDDVTVNLLTPGPDGVCDTGDEAFSATTTTAGGGLYGFADLTPGDYCVEFVAPSGFVFTSQDQGSDDTIDSDANPATGQTATITLAAGDNQTQWDAGLFTLGSIGDFVWNDLNADGIQDPGEPGVDGVTVTLASLGDDPTCAVTDPPSDVATAATAGGGLYSFGDLAAGCYQVTFSDLPPDFVFSPQDQGADDTVDSDADPASGATAPIPLAVGEDNPTIDAGINAPAPVGSIGDFVWNDLNADGIQDPGEPGREGVTVRLSSLGADPTCMVTDPATVLTETTTDADGLYSFEDLEAGCYKITFVGIFLAGLEFSPQNQGSDDTVDSDANPLSAMTAPIPLAAGENNPTIDAGIVVPVSVGSIGDFVWNDLNGDGIQDAGEPGLDGVTLTLRDPGANGTCESDDAVLQTRTTAGGGMYLFNGTLEAGDYCVEVDDTNFAAGGALEGFSVSPTSQGGDPALDSNDDPSLVTLTAADNEDLTIDFGYFTPGAIDIEKLTNGEDADDPPGPAIPIGDPVTWTYVVTNPSPVAIANVMVVDDNGTPGDDTDDFNPTFVGGDDNGDGVLDPTETWTYEEASATAEPGQYGNVAAVTGTDPTGEPVDDDDPSHYFGEAVCGLMLDKQCAVIPPSAGDLACEAKIAATTLRYTGPSMSDATVEFVPKDKDAEAVVYTGVELVSGVTVLTMAAENGFTIDARPNDLGSKLTIRINGVEEVIHTSCSTPYVVGSPAPLNEPKGNPSPTWFVENFVDKHGKFVGMPELPTPSDACTVEARPAPSCDTEDKLLSLAFRFTGGTCADTNNPQEGKFECTDVNPFDPAQPVQIVMTKDASKIIPDPGEVGEGEQFTLAKNDGKKLGGDLMLDIRQNDTVIQKLKIHASCSKRLAAGDVFGALELVKINGKAAGAEVMYLFTVTNNGDPVTGATLVDEVGGMPIFTSMPFDLAAGETKQFELTRTLTETTTNVATVSGTLADPGQVCEAMDEVTVTVEEPVISCVECGFGEDEADKVSRLSLVYTGQATGLVEIYDNADDKPEKLLFAETLDPGQTLDIAAATIGKDSFSSKIGVWVDGEFVAEIHTSCSDVLGPGTTEQTQDKGKDPNGHADILVVSGQDKAGAPLCEAPEPPEACSDCKGKVATLTLEYLGTVQDAEIVVDIVVPRPKSVPGVFVGTVQPGQTFTIEAPDGREGGFSGTIGNEIKLFVNGQENVQVHTSCSKPINPGLVFGDFLVVAAASKDGGAICPLDPVTKRFEAEAEAAPLLVEAVPTEFSLEAAYPNPFNPVTTLRYGLPEASDVRLVVYDVLGRRVEVLVDGSMPAGVHTVTFDAGRLPSGTYFYRIDTAFGTVTRTMVLAK